ncbi:hypothetical protein GCM10020229_07770 [Kitasatospora albolonga]
MRVGAGEDQDAQDGEAGEAGQCRGAEVDRLFDEGAGGVHRQVEQEHRRAGRGVGGRRGGGGLGVLTARRTGSGARAEGEAGVELGGQGGGDHGDQGVGQGPGEVVREGGHGDPGEDAGPAAEQYVPHERLHGPPPSRCFRYGKRYVAFPELATMDSPKVGIWAGG